MRSNKRKQLFDEKPYRPSESNGNFFSITAILGPLILSVVAYYAYYYIHQHGMFILYDDYINYAVKAFIVLEVIIASGRSFVGPLVAALIAGLNLFALTNYNYYTYAPLTQGDSYQLLMVAGAGFVITIIVKFLLKK